MATTTEVITQAAIMNRGQCSLKPLTRPPSNLWSGRHRIIDADREDFVTAARFRALAQHESHNLLRDLAGRRLSISGHLAELGFEDFGRLAAGDQVFPV